MNISLKFYLNLEPIQEFIWQPKTRMESTKSGLVNWMKIQRLHVELKALFEDERWDCNTHANTPIILYGPEIYLGEDIDTPLYADITSMDKLPDGIKNLVRSETLNLLCNLPDLAEKIEGRKGYW